ncbi:hypothetical protein ACFE04_021164 [Oxalis oulophora]
MTILCAYLDGDITRLRASFILGSLIPLGALLFWISIALSLSKQTDQSVDPVELLMRVSWSRVLFMVEAFSLIAVGTSIIETLLGFSESYCSTEERWLVRLPLTKQQLTPIFILLNAGCLLLAIALVIDKGSLIISSV